MSGKILILSFVGTLAGVLAALFAYTHWQTRLIMRNAPAQGEFVDVGDARIHLTQIWPNKTPAATIALVHGASGNEADLRLALGERLTGLGYHVVSVDRPGLGWSTRGLDRSDPADQARQIRRALEKIGVRRAIVVGHSLAGALTLQLALDHADWIAGAVLIAPVTHPWPGGIAAYYTAAATPVIGHVFAHTLALPAGQALIETSLKNVFAPQEPPPDYRKRTALDLALRPATFRANAIDVAGMYDFVLRAQERYRDIAIPVDIITGDRDSIVLADIHSHGSARDIPGSSLHVMAGVGHSPHWARPDEVSGRIAALAQRVQSMTAQR